MAKAAHDWDICKKCDHTVNTHTSKGEVGHCQGYLCTCEEYEKK